MGKPLPFVVADHNRFRSAMAGDKARMAAHSVIHYG